MADTWPVTEAAMSPESVDPWGAMFSPIGSLAGEVVSVYSEGFLNSQRQKAGLPYAQQSAPYTGADGRNLNAAAVEQSNSKQQQLLYAGAGILAIAALVAILK